MTVSNDVPPMIAGVPRKGQTLTTDNGTWTFDEDYLTYAYQWLRCDAAGDNCGDISGQTNPSLLLTQADIGSTIRSQVTATEHTGAPPAEGELKWAPPGYPSYSGYTHINVTNSSPRQSLSTTTDYVVHITEKITADGGVLLNGGRNIVIIGGEIHDSIVLTRAQAEAGELWRQIGLYLPNCKGTVHIEGLYIHGIGCGDGIETGTGAGGATIRVQNCRIQNQHVTQNPGTVGWNGSHPDAFQCYAGPAAWQMYQNTVVSSGTLRTWQPTEFGPNIQSVYMERMDITAQTDVGSYALWDDTPSFWPEFHNDLYFQYDQSGQFHRNGDVAHSAWDPPNGNVTGEAVHYSARPGGDLVPASMVLQGAYVSPGYQ